MTADVRILRAPPRIGQARESRRTSPAQVVWIRRTQGGWVSPRLAAALVLVTTLEAWAGRYGVDEAMNDSSFASPQAMATLGVSLAAGGALGYLVGRRAARTDPSRDPAGYAVLGALVGGPLLALLWAFA
jgi:predicted phage tail protein